MTMTTPSRRRKFLWVALVALFVLAVILIRIFYVPKAVTAKPASPAIPAVTTTVKEEDIPIYLSGIGNVTPVFSVTVNVRIDGQLDKVFFTEGQDVKAGERACADRSAAVSGAARTRAGAEGAR